MKLCICNMGYQPSVRHLALQLFQGVSNVCFGEGGQHSSLLPSVPASLKEKQTVIKWKCVPPSCNLWEHWGGLKDSAPCLFLQIHEGKPNVCEKGMWPSELDLLPVSRYTNHRTCGNIREHVHLCKMEVTVAHLHTSLRRTGKDSVLSECLVLWIKAVALHSCLTVSSLRPSAVDDVILNVSLSDQHFTEGCCSSPLHTDTSLHWGIKVLLPYVPVLIPRSRSVYVYKPVLLCVFALTCVWEREMMMMMMMMIMSAPFLLGLL